MLPTRNNDTIMELDGRIEKFIGKHNVLTLATATEEGAPYCCNLFYAYDKDDKAFVFTSGPHAPCANAGAQRSDRGVDRLETAWWERYRDCR